MGMNKIGSVQTPHGPASILIGRYPAGGAIAVQVVLDDGEPYATASTNLVPYGAFIAGNELTVKDWEENAEITKSLLATGLFEDTGRRVESDFVSAPVWRVKDPSMVPPASTEPERTGSKAVRGPMNTGAVLPTPAPVGTGADLKTTPAIIAVRRILWERMGCDLTDDQALALWGEARAGLPADVVAEINEPETLQSRGSLDTYPREFLMDGVAEAMTGMPWPANCDLAEHSEVFARRARAAIAIRGYAAAPTEDEVQAEQADQAARNAQAETLRG